MLQIFRRKKQILIWASVLLLLLISTPVFLLILVSDNESAVLLRKNKMDTNVAHNVRKLARSVRNGLFSNKKTVHLKISQSEFNQLVALARHSNPRLHGRINVSIQGIYFVFSLYIPENPVGDYVNISFIVVPSDSGLRLDEVKLGGLGFSGSNAKKLSEWALNLVLGSSLGTELLESVQQVSVKGQNVHILYKPVQGLSGKLAHSRKRYRAFRKDMQLGGDPERVKTYIKSLCLFDKGVDHYNKRSLVTYFPVVFTQLSIRESLNEEDRKEYKAAILAMAIYFGTSQFESVIGRILTGDLKSCVSDNKVTLAGRNDLVRHFVVSAGLSVLADNKTSFTIGEFKELLDSDNGGSGFSFVDLAADRTGLRFTNKLLSKAGKQSAIDFLSTLKTETSFFPPVTGLQENLSKHEFDLYYHDVNSPMYKIMVKDIEDRIDRLVFFR